jgi:hypothetical protein
MGDRMTPQQLLCNAYKLGTRFRVNGEGELQFAPAGKLTPKRLQAIKARKRQLTALVVGLGKYGALDDPLILEALALFNGWPSAEQPKPNPIAHQSAFNLEA